MAMFIVRTKDINPPAGFVVKAKRLTPGYAGGDDGAMDYFCEASADVIERLAADGVAVLKLRDGWYEVGQGGVAIWGNGRFWEVRDTPFTVIEAVA